MASQQRTVDFILEQIAASGSVRAKKMFGEYGIYCDDKLVALVCDDQLFLKPTKAGQVFLIDPVKGQPYPGAKPLFVIPGERWDDREWMSRLVQLTATELPSPPIKSAGKKTRSGKAGRK